MSVWLTIPSARPAEQAAEILQKWRDQGYKIAIWRDPEPIEWLRDDSGTPLACWKFPDNSLHQIVADSVHMAPYKGYAAAVNELIKHAMRIDPAAEWFIAAGDDTLPDPSKTAEEIAGDLRAHFWNQYECCYPPNRTFGVMQPTGDRWHEGVGGFANAPIDRVAGSAWYGREYCRRMYGGAGPLYPGYRHMFVDEEAQEVATKMGVFWQRRELTQRHNHWGRGETDQTVIEMKPGTIPPHLEQWNTTKHWQESKAFFLSRKAAGFPGHAPIA